MRWLMRLKEAKRGGDDKRWQEIARRAREEQEKAKALAKKIMNGHANDLVARKK